ncbi:hypothetical protein C8Q69DRAFT_507743 [Paecilomyces variotii]|uniref:Uncharacterized protein n=1 Tax=Byssochlamys spectabilis TaxID=264951 RepID=A0A443HRA5_BYSSP|nr:hypothetical protein C8Q69DRAFT_507743 [Paecilomyces variotii]KAJ9240967.1 hypothetical protein DTO169E5_3662 [Paecilomyces variotii]KAJ9307807.1 hypothetical protein DTO217A2_2563 [Paecilomyces variotii]RWQ94362.1 hypothetical protein C8Q69DRAFT_507743 [Paecilomyces variotii]
MTMISFLFILSAWLSAFSMVSATPTAGGASNTTGSSVSSQATNDDGTDDRGGLLHLGVDGVLRNFDDDWNVVSYKQLSPDEITRMLRSLSYDDETNKELVETFRGVDGRTVTDENALLHPDEDAMPVWAPNSKHGDQREVDNSQSTSTNTKALSSRGEGRHKHKPPPLPFPGSPKLPNPLNCMTYRCRRPDDCLLYNHMYHAECYSCIIPAHQNQGRCSS